MANQRSPATAAVPALLERVKGVVRIAIASAVPLPRALLASLREALEESTIPNRVDVVDLADTDAAFRGGVRREGVLWIGSASA